MEATIVGDGILSRPMDVVDRDAAAVRIVFHFTATRPSPEAVGRSENETLESPFGGIVDSRGERHYRET